MTKFCPMLGAKDVRQLASAYVHDLKSKSHEESEENAIRIGVEAQRTRRLDYEQLIELGTWKSPRIVPLLRRNDRAEVIEVTQAALTATSDVVPIPVLMSLHGVGWPMASVVMHLCMSDPYPIVDYRAFRSLGREEVPNYSHAVWREYTRVFRDLLHQSGVDARTLDRALWQHSYEQDQASR
ncbi:MAG: hypothetical protein KIS87_09575 [Phycisphaeraceae bacterium]|nr:hypothetical protein [Phycisphaeraceae bacterium]